MYLRCAIWQVSTQVKPVRLSPQSSHERVRNPQEFLCGSFQSFSLAPLPHAIIDLLCVSIG